MGYSEICKRLAKNLGIELTASEDRFIADVIKAAGINLPPGEKLTVKDIEAMLDCAED